MTNGTGVVCYDADFTPFGGERPYTNTCSQNYKFTGKERDTETGNDDFGARSYSWRWGRFMTPDPLPGTLLNPQSFNRYPYVLNNPATFTDPTGLECVWENGSFDSNDDPDTGSGLSCARAGGKWITFEGSMGDWSPTANPEIAHWADIIRSADTSVEVKADPMSAASVGWETFKLQTGVFFSGLGDPVLNSLRSFGQGGCNRILVETLAEDIKDAAPIPTSPDVGINDIREFAPKIAAAAALFRAGFYSGYRGLVQPMKSSVFRALRARAVASSEAAEALGGELAVVAVAGHALWNASSAAYNGTCH